MSTNTIIEKIESLKELEELMEEVKAEADSIRDEDAGSDGISGPDNGCRRPG